MTACRERRILYQTDGRPWKYGLPKRKGTVTLVSDLAEISGTGNKREAINLESGKRSAAKLLAAGIRSGITSGGLGSGNRHDPRTMCMTGDALAELHTR